MMLKLKLQYFGHLMGRADSLEKPWCWESLKAGREGDDRGWDGWWHHWHNGHGFGWTPGVGEGQGGLVCCDSWGCKELDTTVWLNWTECANAVESRRNFGLFKTKRKTKWNLLDCYMSSQWSHVYPSIPPVSLFIAIFEFPRMNWNHLLAALHRSSYWCFLNAELVF